MLQWLLLRTYFYLQIININITHIFLGRAEHVHWDLWRSSNYRNESKTTKISETTFQILVEWRCIFMVESRCCDPSTWAWCTSKEETSAEDSKVCQNNRIAFGWVSHEVVQRVGNNFKCSVICSKEVLQLFYYTRNESGRRSMEWTHSPFNAVYRND